MKKHIIFNIFGIKIKIKNKNIKDEIISKINYYKKKKECNGRFDKPVDLVYTWCSSSDENWNNRRIKCLQEQNIEFDKQSINKCRFEDNDELKYSLRSVEKFAPWINKIYIITDNQIPSWLNTNHPKIKIIDHKEIIQEECLPTFNANVIEMHIHKIPELSEHFLFSNDDTFIGKSVTKNFFFTWDGKPYARMKKMIKVWDIIDSLYARTLVQMQKIVFKKHRKHIYLQPHHNIDAYTKEICQRCEELYPEIYQITKTHHFRQENEFHRSLIYYNSIVEKTSILQDTSDSKLSISIGLQSNKFGNDFTPQCLFCLNDNEQVKDEDRKKGKDFLEKYFPVKSQFEL